jgi:hypothetical protein
MRLLPPALVAGCLSAFVSASAFAQTPPKAAWGFEESTGTTTSDSSSNGNTGALSGPTWSAGRIGNALSFDGVNDRVEVADSDTLDFTTGLTISAWLKPASAPSSSVVMVKESATTGWSYALHFLSDGRLQVV